MSEIEKEIFIKKISDEVVYAVQKHGDARWSRHEFYGILKEEVDELWKAIKRNHTQDLLEEELIQVAAVCMRYFTTGDRRHGNFTGGKDEMVNNLT